ncbi:MAG: hypothetical protein JO366_22400 [Methylobacteriaceae bacterium]|nr:hypothetical protein [Methylobacteriaceae bacterium]
MRANEAALDALVVAYPDQLSRHDAERVYFKDGTSLPASDGRPDKPFEEMTRHGSILDQFKIAYPKGAPAAPQGWCARFNRSFRPSSHGEEAWPRPDFTLRRGRDWRR